MDYLSSGVDGFMNSYIYSLKKTCNMPYENTHDDASDSLHNSVFEHFPLSSKAN